MPAYRKLGAVLAIVVFLAGCATAPAQFREGVLTDLEGMTLYIFDKDKAGSGRSVCNGRCAVAWPPRKAEAGASPEGSYTIITHDDGSGQWAYDGKPLYLWVKDSKPGERTEDGFRNVWHVVKEPGGSMRSGY